MKIVLVGSRLGRMGTSATMGLLKIHGCDVGKSLTGKSPMNPKGYFELRSFREFQRNVWGMFYGDNLQYIPQISNLRTVAKGHTDEFKKILEKEFSKILVAFKAQRYLHLAFLAGVPNVEVYVLCMQRGIDAQAKSTQRMWKGSRNPVERDASLPTIKTHIRAWAEHEKRVRAHYGFAKYMDLEFKKLFTKPWKTYKQICKFIEEKPTLDKRQVETWIDPKLVHWKK